MTKIFKVILSGWCANNPGNFMIPNGFALGQQDEALRPPAGLALPHLSPLPPMGGRSNCQLLCPLALVKLLFNHPRPRRPPKSPLGPLSPS